MDTDNRSAPADCRLWQTLILSRWNPLFSHIPVENIVYQHQAEYYDALNKSNENGESSVFIDFMLNMILNAVKSLFTPEVKKMLLLMTGEMTRKTQQPFAEIPHHAKRRPVYKG